MLPRFPQSQKTLDTAYQKKIFEARALIIPHAVHPRTLPIAEGKESNFQQIDGAIRPVEFKNQIASANFEVKDGKGMTREQFLFNANQLGEQLGEAMLRLVLGTIYEAADQSGNIINLNGGEFSKDDFLKIIEGTPHGFDRNGESTNVLLVSPKIGDLLKAKEAEWSKDSVFVERVNVIKRKKREEFDEREARRRLVE